MLRRSVPVWKGSLLSAAAFLLLAPQVMAGGRVVTAGRPMSQTPVAASQPAPNSFAHAGTRQVVISVVVAAPTQPAKELNVELLGPDGLVRRFPAEGGTAAIQYRNVVLRPGGMLTIHWVPSKQ
jgi:hypothetical protein